MLIEETMQKKDKEFICHYSDEDKYILQNETKRLYIKAVDIIPCKYTYKETMIEIEKKERVNLKTEENKVSM